MKKHLLVIFPVLILLLSLCCASADAETIQYGKNTYDLDAVAIDIGDKYISNFEEYYAFLDQFHHLQKVDIPEGVKDLGPYAFTWCKNLQQVVFPDSLETFGDHCLDGAGAITFIAHEGTIGYQTAVNNNFPYIIGDSIQ